MPETLYQPFGNKATDPSEIGAGSAPLDGVKSDTVDLAFTYRGVRVDVGGTVKFNGADGVADTWTCLDGDFIPVRVTRIWSTGTTATGLHGIV